MATRGTHTLAQVRASEARAAARVRLAMTQHRPKAYVRAQMASLKAARTRLARAEARS